MSDSVFYAASQVRERTDEEYVDAWTRGAARAALIADYAASLRPYAASIMRNEFMRLVPELGTQTSARVYNTLMDAQRTAATLARHAAAAASGECAASSGAAAAERRKRSRHSNRTT